jgi:Zn-dependent M28 family amino/carboxypeptidase
MKFFLPLLLLASLSSTAQPGDTARIAQTLPDDQILSPLIYLASDFLKGRHIGLPEIDTAARYIAAQFQVAGAKPLPGNTGYYQIFSHPFTPLDRHHMDPQIASNLTFSTRRGYTLKNIIAVVPGTDPLLRNQYLILSAHYDHAGVKDYPIRNKNKMDSIFNGARDNATGVAAVIAAARFFARYPPRRSILFICYTAEEEGEIGSKYYADHPLIPLDQTVFNLNVDNAGYNTTKAVCLFGLGRTSADSLIIRACNQYRLSVLPEPPGLDFFRRSDNFSLAKKGIPAPNYSLGMTQWDLKIEDYYHRVSDETDNMDLDYVVKFVRAYVLSAQYIANSNAQPKWTEGDEYNTRHR